MQFRQALREAGVPVEHRIEAVDIARDVTVREFVVVGRRHLGFLSVIVVVLVDRCRRVRVTGSSACEFGLRACDVNTALR